MIVKSEAAVLQRCLDSISNHIDWLTIVDTGSTDDTVEIIQSYLEEHPGNLYHDEWVDFGHNRSKSLEYDRDVCDWALIIDADEVITDASGLASLDPSASSYLIEITAAGESFQSKRILREDLDWRYEPEVHAVPVTDYRDVGVVLSDVSIHHYNDGGCKAGRMEWLVSKLEGKDDPRSVFYLANTLRDMGRYEDALPHYLRRASMGGWEEEAWYAHYRAGEMLEKVGRWDEAVSVLTAAIERRPHRVEPVYTLALGYRQRKMRQAAYAWSSYGMLLDQTTPDDILFVASWMYDYAMAFEHSINTYWVGEKDECLRLTSELLGRNLPANIRRQTAINQSLVDGRKITLA